MIYITGDTHRDFFRVRKFCRINETSKEDLLIIAGDAGVNFFLGSSDRTLKKELQERPITFLFVRGNHEERPENIDTYIRKHVDTPTFSGEVYMEDKFPSLMFATDGICRIGEHRCAIINGAYSVDKYWRLEQGKPWFPDEELTDEEMVKIKVELMKGAEEAPIDIVISHTCPQKYEPVEKYFPGLDQSGISKRMEEYLDEIEESIDYKKWYCGHWHTDKTIDKMRFLFNDVIEFG